MTSTSVLSITSVSCLYMLTIHDSTPWHSHTLFQGQRAFTYTTGKSQKETTVLYSRATTDVHFSERNRPEFLPQQAEAPAINTSCRGRICCYICGCSSSYDYYSMTLNDVAASLVSSTHWLTANGNGLIRNCDEVTRLVYTITVMWVSWMLFLFPYPLLQNLD